MEVYGCTELSKGRIQRFFFTPCVFKEGNAYTHADLGVHIGVHV